MATQAEMQAAVLKAGYNGPLTDAAIAAAYDRAGKGIAADQYGNVIGQTTGGGTPTTPTQGDNGLPGTPAQQQAVLAAAAQSAGTTREALAESARQFNATLAQQQLMWQQQGLPELEIAQRSQALEDEQFRAQLALAQLTQAQANAATVAGLTGYYNAPDITPTGSAVQQMQYGQPVGGGGGYPTATAATPGAAGGAFTPSTQAQYIQARTQQLQGQGMGAAQAQQTAQSEWSQGYAQSGNVAYGLPQGISFTAPTTPTQAAAAPAASTWQAPTSAQWMTARTAQLQQNGMGAAQAAQTAQSEWAQGYAQSGNVAYGMPQGISFTPPPAAAAPVAQAPAATGGAASSQDQYMAARMQQLMSVAGMGQGQAQQTAAAEWAQGYAQSGNVAYGMPTGYSATGAPPAATGGVGATGGTSGVPNGTTTPLGTQTLAGAAQQAQLSGMYNGAPTESAREFNSTQALNYLTQAAQLNGPANVFDQASFLRGASSQPNMPSFLGALASNTSLPSFNGVGSQQATPVTMQSLAGGLAGGGMNTDQALSQIGSIFQKGPSQLAAGSIERMTPSELAIFKAGGAKLGYSPDDWLKQYASSGVGQGSGGV
jgi:hypothetical protein